MILINFFQIFQLSILINLCFGNSFEGYGQRYLIIYNSSTDSCRPVYLILRNSDFEKLRTRNFRLKYLTSRIRGGYSKQNGNAFPENFETEDKYHDLRSLFGKNRDENEEQLSSRIDEPPTLPISSLPVVMSSNSIAAVIVGLWSAIPAIVRFVGGYIIMESARNFWNDYRQRRRLQQSSLNGSRFSTSIIDRTVADPNLAYLNGLGSDDIVEIDSDKSTKKDSTRKTSASITTPAASDNIEKLQTEQAELWGTNDIFTKHYNKYLF